MILAVVRRYRLVGVSVTRSAFLSLCFCLFVSSQSRGQSFPNPVCMSADQYIGVFHKNTPIETSWAICWRDQNPYGLVIFSAHFRNGPAAKDNAWIKVLGDSRLVQVLVPYDNGKKTFREIDYRGDGTARGMGVIPISERECGTLKTPDGRILRELRRSTAETPLEAGSNV